MGTTTRSTTLAAGRYALFSLKRYSNTANKRTAHVACPPTLAIGGGQ